MIWERRSGRGSFLISLVLGVGLAGLAGDLLFHLDAPRSWAPPPSLLLALLVVPGYVSWLVQRVRGLPLQLVALAIPIAGLVGFSRVHVPVGRELNAVSGIVLLGFATSSLVAAWRRFRTPLFLRLTEAGIERGGYTLPTPPIPYAAIARVDLLPAENPKAVAITLRKRKGMIARALLLLQGYDLKIGSDLKASAVELASLIRREVPDLRGAPTLQWGPNGVLSPRDGAG